MSQELIRFAKTKAAKRHLPLLAEMWRGFGFTYFAYYAYFYFEGIPSERKPLASWTG